MPATPSTIYGIGSVTKSFTALAVMQLVERGLLSLDDPVDKYLPVELKPFGESVTLEHLLTHSSGVPALAYAEALINGVVEEGEAWLPLANPEDVIPFMRGASEWAVARPGERFFYLNEGYVLLGLIVSKVSRMGYREYVRRNVLEPLGMKRTFFEKELLESDPDRATLYLLRDGRPKPARFPFTLTSDGGLLSNVLDLSKYLAIHIARGKAGDSEILAGSSVEEMERGRIAVPWRVFGDEKYGLGWIVTWNFYGRKLVHHSGSVLVYTAFAGYLPEEGVGVAVLANAAGYSPYKVGTYALALALGEDPGQLPFVKLERLVRRIEGEYEAFKGTMKATVKEEGACSTLTSAGGKYPSSPRKAATRRLSSTR